jgi:uncharacterized protein (TIGR00297 family)
VCVCPLHLPPPSPFLARFVLSNPELQMKAPVLLVSLALSCEVACGFVAPATRLPLITAPISSSTFAPAPTMAMMALPQQTLHAIGLNSGLAALGQARGQRVLTPSGLAHAWALGVILWSTLGWRGWSSCVVYLIGGSFVTKVKKAKKEALGIAEGRGGTRGPENVWGSAATAAMCALALARWPAHAALLRVGFVTSLATKLSDTFASEIGKAYGTTTYLITTLRPCKPGEEGGVSLEGTAAGVLGSIILTAYATAVGLVGRSAVVPCLLAAFIATNIESVIGASAQGRFAWLTNEVVNFTMTLIGAFVGAALFTVLA